MALQQHQRPVTSPLDPEHSPSQSHKRTLVVPQARSAPGPDKQGIAPEWLELDSSNAGKFLSLCGDLLTERRSRRQWHKVTIVSPTLERKKKAVISAINKHIAPHKLFPYFFSIENECITFYVTDCGVELTTLCKQRLKVPFKFGMIEMKVKLFCKYFNLYEALKLIVSKRLDRENKYLDLSRLNSIPEVEEMMFDKYDSLNIVDQLLRVAKVMVPRLVSLSLASNRLATLKPLGKFLHRFQWKSLRVLDLTDNRLNNIGCISLACMAGITELHLHGNPICQNWLPKDLYVSLLIPVFPYLYKLDGTYLTTIAPMPYWKPNFILNGSCGDSEELADQFIEHFFTLYDEADRMTLRGLYHKDAYFSISCLCLDLQSTSNFARLDCYRNQARNFLRKPKMWERPTLSHGSEEILERISELPVTRHDPYSFTVDLLLHSRELTVVIVTGIFCDVVKEERPPRHFMRTFVLTGLENDEYQIINDIMYVTNVTSREAEEAFRFLKPSKIIKKK